MKQEIDFSIFTSHPREEKLKSPKKRLWNVPSNMFEIFLYFCNALEMFHTNFRVFQTMGYLRLFQLLVASPNQFLNIFSLKYIEIRYKDYILTLGKFIKNLIHFTPDFIIFVSMHAPMTNWMILSMSFTVFHFPRNQTEEILSLELGSWKPIKLFRFWKLFRLQYLLVIGLVIISRFWDWVDKMVRIMNLRNVSLWIKGL